MSQPLKNQSVVRQPTAFMSKRPRFSKPRYDSQVDVNNDLSKPVTTHYLPKEREVSSAKPHHMIASSNSRISSKNMPRFSSNDMVHNHYLEEAKKRTQERSRNAKPSLMHSTRSKSIANGSKPMPRRNTQTSKNWPASKNSFVTTKTMPITEHSRNSRTFFDSKHFVCSTCQKCVFSANHDSCVTKFLKEVNSRAKVPIRQRTEINPKWKPAGKVFKTVGLRWVPTGKIFASSMTKVDSEPLNGSNADITNQYECKQTLDVNAVLRYDGDECDKGIMPTKIKLTLEQSQQGVSNDVLVRIKGVEELKINVWIKDENKAALPTLKAETGSTHMLSVFTKVNSGIEYKTSWTQ
nr:hypothetical protein [Tanacetum cinerariifolium]